MKLLHKIKKVFSLSFPIKEDLDEIDNSINSLKKDVLGLGESWLECLKDVNKEIKFLIQFKKMVACEHYPDRWDDSVCAKGSDISGPFICTKEYAKKCKWTNEEKEEE